MATRCASPVKHFMRTATADAELAGKKIAKGDWMMLSYPSGNRDEAVFTDPFKFDVERTPNKHVAFGYGAPGLQSANFLVLFGAIDRLGGFFVLTWVRSSSSLSDCLR